eukprot:1374185-Pyramimonas_sp.AAC.1
MPLSGEEASVEWLPLPWEPREEDKDQRNNNTHGKFVRSSLPACHSTCIPPDPRYPPYSSSIVPPLG